VRYASRTVVFVVSQRQLKEGAGWRNNVFHYFRPALEPGAFDFEPAFKELAPNLTSGDRILAQSLLDQHHLHVVEEANKGVYRYAGKMTLAQKPTLIQNGSSRGLRYLWHFQFVHLDGGEAPRINDYVPSGFFAKIPGVTSPEIETEIIASLNATPGIRCAFASDPTSWPGSLAAWPHNTFALVALEDESCLGPLLSTLDRIYDKHSIKAFDQRDVAQRVNGGRLAAHGLQVQECKHVVTLKTLRTLSKRYRQGAFEADDLFTRDYREDQAIHEAFETIDHLDEIDRINATVAKEIPEPTLLPYPGEDLPREEVTDETMDEPLLLPGHSPPKKRDYSDFSFD
jgi:hypothetical protein